MFFIHQKVEQINGKETGKKGGIDRLNQLCRQGKNNRFVPL